MKLEDIVKREKSYLVAAATSIITGVLDSVSTSLAISEYNHYTERIKVAIVERKGPPADESFWFPSNYGISLEQNPIAQYFMYEYGVDLGLLLHSILVVPPILGLAYLVNKINIKQKPGNLALYVASGWTAVIAINNFYYANYYSGLLP